MHCDPTFFFSLRLQLSTSWFQAESQCLFSLNQKCSAFWLQFPTITRRKQYLKWTLKDKLDSLLTVQQSGTSDGRKELKTAGALFTKKGGDKRCAFCLGGHLPVDCKKVQDIGECKKLSLNYGRCFSCIEKIHRSHHCSITVECKVCNGQDSCPLGK